MVVVAVVLKMATEYGIFEKKVDDFQIWLK